MASMPEKEAGNVPGPPVAFFTEVESVILRHLAENASPRTIAAATELTLPEVGGIQSLIAQKIELRNADRTPQQSSFAVGRLGGPARRGGAAESVIAPDELPQGIRHFFRVRALAQRSPGEPRESGHRRELRAARAGDSVVRADDSGN